MRSSLRSSEGQTNLPPRPPVCTREAWATPSTMAGFTDTSSPPPDCAPIWICQVFSTVYMLRKASAMDLPTVSRPWLRSIKKLAVPMSACNRAFSSSRIATPS